MNASLPQNGKLMLKEPNGWFAAGQSFREALALLSDGAFRLFAYLCLEADRNTGQLHATHKDLAAALKKSKRAIGTYVAELQASAVCTVKTGRNQFEPTQLEISEKYWPYRRVAYSAPATERDSYVSSVREWFLSLGCVEASFNSADAGIATDMHQKAVPLAVVEQALLTGACRKYSSWIEGRGSEPIRSLAYFKDIVAEIQAQPLPPGYDGYLRKKVKQLAAIWNEASE